MIDPSLQQYLNDLEKTVNEQIDKLIPLRDNAALEDKYPLRYVCRKMENIIGEIHKAQDKLNVHMLSSKDSVS